MAQVEQVEQLEQEPLGNTKTKGNKGIQIIQSKYWCFTLNNYIENELEQLEQEFSKLGKWIYGKEIGESGTKHLQGYIEFDIKARPLEKIKDKRIHWEKRKGTKDQAIEYCKKDGDYKSNMKDMKILKKLACENNLYEWQKKIIEIIEKEPDDRTINWFWEDKGMSGKSTFCKYLSRKYGAIPLEGKKNDILYVAAEYESSIYVFDIERSMDEAYVSYGAIEKIKNGFYMCGKYEGKPIDRDNPHVIIFSNYEPDYSKMSKDRWNVVNIREGEDISSMND